MLGVIGYGDADLFVAEGVCQLAGMVPAVSGVGFGGELYGVAAAEGVAEAGSVEGHGGPWCVLFDVLVVWWALYFGGPSPVPCILHRGRGLLAAEPACKVNRGGSLASKLLQVEGLRVVALACVGCR